MAQYTPSVPESVSPQSVGELICVLLHEPGAEPSVRLCRALANKGIQVRACTDAYAALGMVCRAEREAGVTLSILLLAEPGRLCGAVELVELAGVYAPKSVCWMYTGSPPEQVREVRADDLVAWRSGGCDEEAQEPVPEVATMQEPTLRIVNGPESGPGEGPDVRVGGLVDGGSDDPGRTSGRTDIEDEVGTDPEPVLTDEELSMLLADELGEHDSNGGHG